VKETTWAWQKMWVSSAKERKTHDEKTFEEYYKA
jgi:hypothetical protein